MTDARFSSVCNASWLIALSRNRRRNLIPFSEKMNTNSYSSIYTRNCLQKKKNHWYVCMIDQSDQWLSWSATQRPWTFQMDNLSGAIGNGLIDEETPKSLVDVIWPEDPPHQMCPKPFKICFWVFCPPWKKSCLRNFSTSKMLCMCSVTSFASFLSPWGNNKKQCWGKCGAKSTPPFVSCFCIRPNWTAHFWHFWWAFGALQGGLGGCGTSANHPANLPYVCTEFGPNGL